MAITAIAANPEDNNDPANMHSAVNLLDLIINAHATALTVCLRRAFGSEVIESNDVVVEFDLHQWDTDGGFVPPEL